MRVVDGRVYVNDVPMRDDFVPAEYRSHDDWGPRVVPEGYYFVMGDHPQQQLRQPSLGLRAEEGGLRLRRGEAVDEIPVVGERSSSPSLSQSSRPAA